MSMQFLPLTNTKWADYPGYKHPQRRQAGFSVGVLNSLSTVMHGEKPCANNDLAQHYYQRQPKPQS